MTTAASRAARTVRADILAQTAYPVAPSAAGVIKLDAMECPYPLPEGVRQAIAHAAQDTALHRYPQADLTALKAEVANAFGVPPGADLLFGNGSDELIHLLIQACCEPGDTVLSPWPSFVYFEMAARFDHAHFEGVPLTADLELDLPAMLAAIERHQPKIVFLALPNNPTGGLWPDEAVDAILEAAPGWSSSTRPTSRLPATAGCRASPDCPMRWSCAPSPKSDWLDCGLGIWPGIRTGSPRSTKCARPITSTY
ncbi:histidinol-phosphate aminotransferase 2 [Bordetella holmesii 70147]|nr:histidinol-phosphate aminotransferase 2 [Bordetella holmesii 70147]